ncbi:hypothetical protein L6164_024758 [Bauhinia variegata]|uniref:Uncharacterized protein n=1 Tax=Bauhinia variegata TaxID=167791 RepID=A0ACB9LZY3_BAUVA|nr:hypothetical protein L6164_024758 [Bauhinia variegata]
MYDRSTCQELENPTLSTRRINISCEFESDPDRTRVTEAFCWIRKIDAKFQSYFFTKQKLEQVIGDINITNSSSCWLRKMMRLHGAT